MVDFTVCITGAIDTDADKAQEILRNLAGVCASLGLGNIKGYIEHHETIKGALE